MTSALRRPAMLPFAMLLVAGCAQPGVYRHSIALTPALDTTPDNWEQRAARVLAARGYDVATHGPGGRLRAVRPRDGGGRDIVSVWRSSEPYATARYADRFTYEISGRSVGASGAPTGMSPAVRPDVDSLITEFEALRAVGSPAWVGRLTCAMQVGVESDFAPNVVRVYDDRPGPALLLRSPRVRETVGYSGGGRSIGSGTNSVSRTWGGLSVLPDDTSGLLVQLWRDSDRDEVALSDAILRQCGGRAQPSPTDASGSR